LLRALSVHRGIRVNPEFASRPKSKQGNERERSFPCYSN
jgi:hypothetical protein